MACQGEGVARGRAGSGEGHRASERWAGGRAKGGQRAQATTSLVLRVLTTSSRYSVNGIPGRIPSCGICRVSVVVWLSACFLAKRPRNNKPGNTIYTVGVIGNGQLRRRRRGFSASFIP